MPLCCAWANCNTFSQIQLNAGSNTSAYGSTYLDSNTQQMVRSIRFNIEAVLANGCQSFVNTTITNQSTFVHNIVINGKEKNCPNIVCTQAITNYNTSKNIDNAAIGNHTLNFIVNGATVLTKQVSVQ